jgi:predicted transcriptional regulator
MEERNLILMTVQDVALRLGLRVVSGGDCLGREVHGGYVGDLLSDVIAHSGPGQVWLTVQGHVNIVAVAVLKELAAIILVNGRSASDDTVRRAGAEQIPLLASSLPAFDLAGKLSTLGVTNEA